MAVEVIPAANNWVGPLQTLVALLAISFELI